MLQINNSPAFTGNIFKGREFIVKTSEVQDNNMIKAATDELILSGAVKQKETEEGKDTITNYMIGDSFEVKTVIGPTHTREGMGGMMYRSHDLKSLEFGYTDNDDNKCVWKFEPQDISEKLKENFLDLLSSEKERTLIQGFMNVLKGNIFPPGSF